ncbi:MAG: hypothetical protein V4596_12965 [Bdellovibrionota bacterium]
MKTILIVLFLSSVAQAEILVKNEVVKTYAFSSVCSWAKDDLKQKLIAKAKTLNAESRYVIEMDTYCKSNSGSPFQSEEVTGRIFELEKVNP